VVINGNKSAAHTDSPDSGTGKMCHGGGMHCSIAYSLECVFESDNVGKGE